VARPKIISFACPSDVVADPRAARPTSRRPKGTVSIAWGEAPPSQASTVLLDEQLKAPNFSANSSAFGR